MRLHISRSDDRSVGMAHQDDLFRVKSFAKVIHEFVRIEKRPFKSHCRILSVVVFKIRFSAASLIPADNGVIIDQWICKQRRDRRIRAGRTAMDIEDDRIVFIPAPDLDILLLPADRRVELFADTPGSIDIAPKPVDVSACDGNDSQKQKQNNRNEYQDQEGRNSLLPFLLLHDLIPVHKVDTDMPDGQDDRGDDQEDIDAVDT